jgi:hypothetical protein
MRSRSLIALTAAGCLALASVTDAAKPPKPPKPKPGGYTLTIAAAPTPVVFPQASVLTGKLAGPTKNGVSVRLEQDATAPFGDKYVATGAVTTTAASGAYQFTPRPAVNTQYRVVAKTTPETTSAAQLVGVRPLIGIALSDSTPRRGALVRFSGSVRPAHDGLVVAIQRRTSTGGWSSVATTRLLDAGTTRSTYTRQVRIRRNGVYRVKLSAHSDHATGYSRLRTIVVH